MIVERHFRIKWRLHKIK